MGFLDSIREALGGDQNHQQDAPPEPRHVDRDAPQEPQHGPNLTGGKHARRD